MQTIYRATDNPTATKGAHFAESRIDAEAYLDNQGYGGATVYEYSVDDANVLRCDSVTELVEIYMSSLDADDDRSADDIRSDWTDSGISYVHDALEQVDGLVDLLAKEYDWVVFVDSYPDDCTTWRYLETVPISPVA